MEMQGRRSPWLLWVAGLTLTVGGCVAAPEAPSPQTMDEARRAAQLMQAREHALSSLRAEVASTRIAAAKQEAELHALRTTVTQLRRENSESQQALFDAKRALDARQAELATLKAERDQLAQAHPPSDVNDRAVAALQDTVASLSRDLTQLKQAIAYTTVQPAADAAGRTHKDAVEAGSGPLSANRFDPPTVPSQERAEGIMPAMHVIRENTRQPRPFRITVQPGDSHWSLARKHQTTIDALRAVNGIEGHHLTVGEELRLP